MHGCDQAKNSKERERKEQSCGDLSWDLTLLLPKHLTQTQNKENPSKMILYNIDKWIAPPTSTSEEFTLSGHFSSVGFHVTFYHLFKNETKSVCTSKHYPHLVEAIQGGQCSKFTKTKVSKFNKHTHIPIYKVLNYSTRLR